MSKADEIPALSYIAEPLSGLLTLGCLVNRRRSSQLKAVQRAAMPARPDRLSFFKWPVTIPDTTPYEARLVSRFLARFPFLMEVWYWLLTYWVYQIARAAQALTMGKGTWEISKGHGEMIVWLEKMFWLDIEIPLQGFVMARPHLLWFFNKTYAMVHIPATIAFFGYSYFAFPTPIFQRVRRTLVLCNCIAFIIFTLWPCMPPRLLPFEEYGFVDTLHTGKAASIWTTNKFQNQLAAFPSLHFGYSWVIGVALHVYSPHKVVKLIAPVYPLLILLVIMGTANHYFLDAVGGFFVTILAHKLNHVLLNLRPIEEWGFWLCGVDKPLDGEIFQRLLAEQSHHKWEEQEQGLLQMVPSPDLGSV